MELILYIPKRCFVLGRNPLNTVCYCIESESESQSVASDSMQPHGLYSPWNSPGQNTGVGSLSLLQRIFPTQGLNPGLLHCRQILYQLSHKGSPRILEWVAYAFSRGSSQPRNWTQVLCSHCYFVRGLTCLNAGLISFSRWAVGLNTRMAGFIALCGNEKTIQWEMDLEWSEELFPAWLFLECLYHWVYMAAKNLRTLWSTDV